jgi:putative oxidoreductase
MLTYFDRSATWQSEARSVLRIMTGLLLLQHGLQKLFAFPDPTKPVPEIASLMGVAGIIEFIGALLFIIGLFTRPVAFILAGFTAVAYFMAHAPQGFYPILNAGELAILYCFVFLYFVASGPGSWSVDAKIG